MRPPTEEITRAVTRFIGSYSQVPPPFSAKKVNGVRAYNLARLQRPVKVLPKPVNVEELTILSIDGPLVQCRVVCSAGFYVRSLAHDLGKVLGCGGCLETLRRERHGPFNIQAAVPLAQIVEKRAWVATQFVPMGSLLPSIPAVVVSDQGARRAAHGNPLRVRVHVIDAATCGCLLSSGWAATPQAQPVFADRPLIALVGPEDRDQDNTERGDRPTLEQRPAASKNRPTDPQDGADPPQPVTPIPPITDADRAAAFPDVEAREMQDDTIHFFVLLEQLEWQRGDASGVAWDSTNHNSGRLDPPVIVYQKAVLVIPVLPVLLPGPILRKK